jgi:hypothetical protein
MQMGMVNLMTVETRVLNEFDYNIRRNCMLSIKGILGIHSVLTCNYSNRSKPNIQLERAPFDDSITAKQFHRSIHCLAF